MKRHLLLATLSLMGAPAFAQTGAGLVDGDWIGKGSFQLGPTVLACSEIRMKFVGTASLLTRISHKAKVRRAANAKI
jgi:hypothetical protein